MRKRCLNERHRCLGPRRSAWRHAWGAALVVCALGLASASANAAGTSFFCPSSTSGSIYIFLHGYTLPGDRCTQHYNTLNQVRGGNEYAYYTCLTAKPYADGSGGNVFAAVCQYAADFVTGYYPQTDTYATIINRQGSGHNGFWGKGNYGG